MDEYVAKLEKLNEVNDLLIKSLYESIALKDKVIALQDAALKAVGLLVQPDV